MFLSIAQQFVHFWPNRSEALGHFLPFSFHRCAGVHLALLRHTEVGPNFKTQTKFIQEFNNNMSV